MISTKGRYAIRFLIDLAEHTEDDRPVALDEIAARQDISKKYLEIVVKMLVQGKMVKGTSGKGGGYRLLRKPEDYSILEVLELTEGSLAPVACLKCDAEECSRKDNCQTLPMWEKFNNLVQDYFSSVSIADLIRQTEP